MGYNPLFPNFFFLYSVGVQPFMLLKRLEMLFASNSSNLAAISETGSLLDRRS